MLITRERTGASGRTPWPLQSTRCAVFNTFHAVLPQGRRTRCPGSMARKKRAGNTAWARRTQKSASTTTKTTSSHLWGTAKKFPGPSSLGNGCQLAITGCFIMTPVPGMLCRSWTNCSGAVADPSGASLVSGAPALQRHPDVSREGEGRARGGLRGGEGAGSLVRVYPRQCATRESCADSR